MKLDKKINIAMAICAISFAAGIVLIVKSIDDSGGVINIIVELGKEVKSISKEIDEG